MLLREEFIAKVNEKSKNISQLCRDYNISRPTAYKWLARYSLEGCLAFYDRSKKPLRMPSKINDESIDLILKTRDQYPSWGAKKLRQILINAGHKNLPSISTFNRAMHRHNQITKENSEKRKHGLRFERANPNELWQMDFKGYFSLSEGKCYPLTVLDDCSRYSICLKACCAESEIMVHEGLEEAFRRYGLPEAMTMDNGSPWKGGPGQRLSKLTIWLMKLGIRVGHSRPYHPQTQGKDERFHRSLKEEVLKYHNFKDLSDAQLHFNEWQHLYNHVRPHEALNMLCPAQKYKPSLKKFPETLPEIKYESNDEIRHVSRKGEAVFRGKNYYMGECLKGEPVAFRQRGENKWDIYYANSRLGGFDEKV